MALAWNAETETYIDEDSGTHIALTETGKAVVMWSGDPCEYVYLLPETVPGVVEILQRFAATGSIKPGEAQHEGPDCR